MDRHIYSVQTRRDAMELTRASNLFNAKLAEQAERFDEMMQFMKLVAKDPQEFSKEERNLFSVACKAVIGNKRCSWRVLQSIEQQGLEEKKELIISYKKTIERELASVSNEVIMIIEKQLLPW